ncbi:hypothetical protein XENORESO_015595 [Xenotaenia resolanae]|uniref:Uncharacterized protein n=1 Tax=Xenotaenia resolanae TaxID=208358 RepID=A0ABV0W4N5_9TELE
MHKHIHPQEKLAGTNLPNRHVGGSRNAQRESDLPMPRKLPSTSSVNPSFSSEMHHKSILSRQTCWYKLADVNDLSCYPLTEFRLEKMKVRITWSRQSRAMLWVVNGYFSQSLHLALQQ